MGVYIKNMKKPTSCDVCQFMRSCDKWTAKFIECNSKNGKTWIPTYPIPDTCPLIEVKTPHGRFIDVGELEEDDAWDDYEDGFTAYSRLQINTQPTIIEAEDE